MKWKPIWLRRKPNPTGSRRTISNGQKGRGDGPTLLRLIHKRKAEEMMPITRSNLKPLLVLIVAAISAGITYIVQHHQADLLRQENRDLIAKQEKLAKERDSALESERSRTNELEQLRKHQNELLRLRGELSQ